MYVDSRRGANPEKSAGLDFRLKDMETLISAAALVVGLVSAVDLAKRP